MKNLISTKYLSMISEHCDFSRFDRKSILITGGTGMIGSYLIESIILGCQIQGYRPLKIKIGGESIDNSEKNIYSELPYVEYSANYLKDANSVGQNQIVFHLASPASPTKYHDLESLRFANSGCLNIILNPYVEKLIFFSSGEVYGNQAGKLLQEDQHQVFNLSNKREWYPYAKLEGEEKCRELSNLYGFDLAVVRLFHTFGPGIKKNDGRSFADFLYSVIDGNPPTLKSRGKDVRTFLFSADAVVAFINIFNHYCKINTYNVGDNKPITILELAQKISEIAGLNGRTKFNFAFDELYEHSPNHSIVPDLTRISSLGWKNRSTLEDAIKETLLYIKSCK